MHRPDHQEPFSNGSALQIGMVLGQIQNEGERQTEILLSMLTEQRELPQRIAAHLNSGRERKEGFASTALEWLERIQRFAPYLFLATTALGALGVHVPEWLKAFSEHSKPE